MAHQHWPIVGEPFGAAGNKVRIMRFVHGSATFSNDRSHRYRLLRTWDLSRPTITWLMLNPSRADAMRHDQTIRRVIGFSQRHGYGGCRIVNLFSWIEPDSRKLRAKLRCWGADRDDAVNQAYVQAALETSAPVVTAWGNAAAPFLDRHWIATMAGPAGGWLTLGHTALGQPRHPLRLAGETRLTRWQPGWLKQ